MPAAHSNQSASNALPGLKGRVDKESAPIASLEQAGRANKQTKSVTK